MNRPGQARRISCFRHFYCLLFGFVVSLGCEGPAAQNQEGPGHRAQRLALTPEQEVTLGEKSYQEILSKAHVLRGGPEVQRIREVGERIAKVAQIEPLQREINLNLRGYRFEWEFNVIESNQVNAFCLPGGKVAVFTGLLPVAEDNDQLATVMGHEIAHALAHHASERIARQQMYQTAVNAASTAGGLGQLDEGKRRLLMGLLSAGTQVRSLSYDRAQESEADHIGVFLMTFAGYDPEEAVRFWIRMHRQMAGHGHPPEIMSDHPSDEKRIAEIKAWAPKARAALQAYKAGRIAPPRNR